MLSALSLLGRRRGEEELAAAFERAGQTTLSESVLSLLNLDTDCPAISFLSLEEKRGVVDIGSVGAVSLTAGLKPTGETGVCSLRAGREELTAAVYTGALDTLIILIVSP